MCKPLYIVAYSRSFVWVLLRVCGNSFEHLASSQACRVRRMYTVCFCDSPNKTSGATVYTLLFVYNGECITSSIQWISWIVIHSDRNKRNHKALLTSNVNQSNAKRIHRILQHITRPSLLNVFMLCMTRSAKCQCANSGSSNGISPNITVSNMCKCTMPTSYYEDETCGSFIGFNGIEYQRSILICAFQSGLSDFIILPKKYFINQGLVQHKNTQQHFKHKLFLSIRSWN